MSPRFRFPAADVDAAGLPVEADLPADWLTAELADTDARAGTEGVTGHVSGRLSRSGPSEIVVRAKVRAAIAVPCARCLEPARTDVATEISLLLRQQRSAPPKDRKSSHDAAASKGPKKARPREDDEGAPLTDAEASLDTYDGDWVVLDPFIREAILLEVPIFPLCSESCAGIAGAEGARVPKGIARDRAAAAAGGGSNGDRGELDPRLAPLAALRDRLAGIAPDEPSAARPALAAERGRPTKLRLPTSGLRPRKKR